MSGDHFSSAGYANADLGRVIRSNRDYERKQATKITLAFVAFMERNGFVLIDEKPIDQAEITKLANEFAKEYVG